jgi:hypothetical protein
MTRLALAFALTLVVGSMFVVWLARRLGRSGSRASILISVVAGWIAAWTIWSMIGGLAAHYGVIERYDSTIFAALAIGAGIVQYNTQVRQGRERGLAIFVGAQLLWLAVVMVRNGLLGP